MDSRFCREFLSKLLIPGDGLGGRGKQLDNSPISKWENQRTAVSVYKIAEPLQVRWEGRIVVPGEEFGGQAQRAVS